MLEEKLKELIIETLNLEDISPSEIDTEEPLFYEGLGLDSLDALEIAVVFSKKYGIELKNDPEDNRLIFGSIQSMAKFVEEYRAK